MTHLTSMLKKRGSKDLSKKLEGGKCTPEEKEAITSILIGRGVMKAPEPVKVVLVSSKKVKAKKKPATVSSEDIICEFLSVGQTTKFVAKSRDENNGKEIEGTVVKIYNCGRTGKQYVRLKADGHVYHKRLNTFEPVGESVEAKAE